MILENKYNKVIKGIEVTPEMQERILKNISQTHFENSAQKVVSIHRYRKYLTIAACFVILIFGSYQLYDLTHLSEVTPDPSVTGTMGIVDYNTIDALSEAIGFKMKTIKENPFDIDTTQFTSYWKDLAEIEYTGQSNSIVLRMSYTTEDVSGDFTVYENIQQYKVNNLDVTLKGNDGQYVLAVWQNEGYSYSLQFSLSVSEEIMLETIKSIK